MDTPEVFYNGGPGPAWLDKNAWAIPVQVSQENVDKMPKIALHNVELKVHMCCPKCAEIVCEEIRYVGGVFDVKVDQKQSKVTVIGRPDPDRVLRRAKKVDRHATFWPPSPPPPVVEVVVVEVPDKKKEDKKEEVVVVVEETKTTVETKEEKTEETTKEETKKEEKKKETKDEGEKKKETGPPPVVLLPQQYVPYQPMYESYAPYGYGYTPSQSYQPLYPDHNNGYYGPPMPFMNPNYLKHVKIAY